MTQSGAPIRKSHHFHRVRGVIPRKARRRTFPEIHSLRLR